MGSFGVGAELSLGRGRTGAGVAVAAFDFTAAALPPGATLTRASAGMRVNSGGLLVSEAANLARFDHDPATLMLRGLLVEGAATNLALQSSAFASPPWTTGAAAATVGLSANTATAPDGTMTADAVNLSAIAMSSASAYQEVYQTLSDASTSPRALSIWLRGAVGGEQIGIEYATADGGFGWDPASRLLTLTTSWQRYVLLGSRAGTSCYAVLGLDFAAVGAVTAPGRTIHAWGMQVERGGSASSHIPTTSAAASRSADVLTLDWAAKGVADGAVTLRYIFDDLSTQDAATTVSGGSMIVPTNLNRAVLRRVEKV